MSVYGTTKHILASILAALAIVASPLLVCACAHHPKPVAEKVEVSSCHKQAHDGDAGDAPAATSAEAACDCVAQAAGPKFIVKNDNKKPVKHIAAAEKICIGRQAVIDPASAAETELYAPALFAPDRYLNLSPGRAPPAL